MLHDELLGMAAQICIYCAAVETVWKSVQWKPFVENIISTRRYAQTTGILYEALIMIEKMLVKTI